MSANGLPGHSGCHYAFSGYEQHGLHSYHQLARELYGAADLSNIDPPNPLRVEFASPVGDRLHITLRREGDTIGVHPAALLDFALGGDGSLPSSSVVTSDGIDLQYDRPILDAATLSYLGHNGSTPGWVTNANGVGLLTFTEPIINPFLHVHFLSPKSPTAVPGELLTLVAQATPATGAVTQMELLVDGLLIAGVNNTNYIEAPWTAPAAYSHRITALAFDSNGNQVEESMVVFGGLPSAPGGVSNGLNVWLRPETGIQLDEQGLVARWQDSSGQGNDCVQTNASARPAYVSRAFDERPGLLFMGSQFLSASKGMSTGSYTKIVRCRLTTQYSLGSLLSAGPTKNVGHMLYLGPRLFPMLWDVGYFLTSAIPLDVFQPHVVTETFDGSTRLAVLYVDGLQVGSHTASANNSEPSWQLGAFQNSDFLEGAVGEVLIYNRVLSTAERTSVENYVSSPPQFPLVIQSVGVSNGMVTITWSATPGQSYCVQGANALGGMNWQSLATNTSAADATASWSEPIGSTMMRFYRVLLVPNEAVAAWSVTNTLDASVAALGAWVPARRYWSIDSGNWTWTDMTGHGYDMTSTNWPIISPAALNGFDTLNFTTGGYYRYCYANLTSSVPCYVFMLLSLTNTGAPRAVIDSLDTAERGMVLFNNKSLQAYEGSGYVTLTQPVTNQWFFFEVDFMGDATTGYTNGTQTASGNAGNRARNGILVALANNWSLPQPMALATMAVYTNMTSAARSNIWHSVKAQFGL
jgi:hypothetical protein